MTVARAASGIQARPEECVELVDSAKRLEAINIALEACDDLLFVSLVLFQVALMALDDLFRLAKLVGEIFVNHRRVRVFIVGLKICGIGPQLLQSAIEVA